MAALIALLLAEFVSCVLAWGKAKNFNGVAVFQLHIMSASLFIL